MTYRAYYFIKDDLKVYYKDFTFLPLTTRDESDTIIRHKLKSKIKNIDDIIIKNITKPIQEL